MTGDDAIAAVQDRPWQPAVKTLVAYPDLLERMADSPQWTYDLGNAYLAQEEQVIETVQALRQRAAASGYLRSDGYQSVQTYGHAVAVLPAVSHVYYVRYYDPLVVYGPWRQHHRPVYWRPWAPRPVFVSNVVVVHPRHHRPHYHQQPQHRPPHRPPAQHRPPHHASPQPYHRVPEAQRQPIVQSRVQPAFPQNPNHHRQQRAEPRREQRSEQRREQRAEPRREQRGDASRNHSRSGRS
jgi:hypothetical protein